MYALRQIQRRIQSLGNVAARRYKTRTYCASTGTAGSVEENYNGSEAARSVSIDETTIRRIERLALVGLEYERSKRVLEEAVVFAERLRRAQIDDAVRPMYSTLENEHIRLRDDVTLPRDTIDRREVLRNSAVLEEEYFVAPLTTGRNDRVQQKRQLRKRSESHSFQSINIIKVQLQTIPKCLQSCFFFMLSTATYSS